MQSNMGEQNTIITSYTSIITMHAKDWFVLSKVARTGIGIFQKLSEKYPSVHIVTWLADRLCMCPLIQRLVTILRTTV